MNRKETLCSLMIVFKSFAELCPWAVTFTSASYWPFRWWNKVSEGLELGIFFSQGYLRSGKTPIDSVLVKYFLLREDLVKNRVLWAYFRIAIFSLILWKAWGFLPLQSSLWESHSAPEGKIQKYKGIPNTRPPWSF